MFSIITQIYCFFESNLLIFALQCPLAQQNYIGLNRSPLRIIFWRPWGICLSLADTSQVDMDPSKSIGLGKCKVRWTRVHWPLIGLEITGLRSGSNSGPDFNRKNSSPIQTQINSESDIDSWHRLESAAEFIGLYSSRADSKVRRLVHRTWLSFRRQTTVYC